MTDIAASLAETVCKVPAVIELVAMVGHSLRSLQLVGCPIYLNLHMVFSCAAQFLFNWHRKGVYCTCRWSMSLQSALGLSCS